MRKSRLFWRCVPSPAFVISCSGIDRKLKDRRHRFWHAKSSWRTNWWVDWCKVTNTASLRMYFWLQIETRRSLERTRRRGGTIIVSPLAALTSLAGPSQAPALPPSLQATTQQLPSDTTTDAETSTSKARPPRPYFTDLLGHVQILYSWASFVCAPNTIIILKFCSHHPIQRRPIEGVYFWQG